MQRFVLGMLFSLALIFGSCGDAIAAGEAADAPPPEPVTTADPEIPVEELELLLKPLTKGQLLIEAKAWQAFVQAKAEQISRAEITVKRQNQEIEKTEQIKEDAGRANLSDHGTELLRKSLDPFSIDRNPCRPGLPPDPQVFDIFII